MEEAIFDGDVRFLLLSKAWEDGINGTLELKVTSLIKQSYGRCRGDHFGAACHVEDALN